MADPLPHPPNPDDPSHPLSYPGTAPSGSGLVLAGSYRHVEPAALDSHLEELRQPCLGDRQPVIAIGANASPARLRAKFRRANRPLTAVPMTSVRVHGVGRGVSAHVSRFGYIPATPVVAATAAARLFVIWLDRDQLPVIDATEPNYRRVPIGDGLSVTAPDNDRTTTDYHLYAGRHGCLVDARGKPRVLTQQADLIQTVLAESAAVKALVGPTLRHWLAAVTDRGTRARIHAIWTAEGRILHRLLPS